MRWCYRIIKYDALADVVQKGKRVKDIRYEICEMFYDEKTKSVYAFSAADLYDDTLERLKKSYRVISEAFKHPVIEYRGGNFYEGKKKLKKGKIDAQRASK